MITKNQHKSLFSSLKNTTLSKGIGVLFFIGALFTAILVQHPSKVLCFIIYAFIGVAIALLLSKSAEHTNASFKGRNFSVRLIGGVALPFILFFTNPIGAIKADDDLPLSVTVFVHSKKGRQDMILRQQGYVIMDVDGERKRTSINENGQAFFQNLHVGDKVRLNIDFSEPYKAIFPDSVYVISYKEGIYLQVALQGIEKVEGTVLDNGSPLKGVTVRIGSLTDTTDNTGFYRVIIPEALEAKEYEVWFIKEGFKTESLLSTPQIGRPLNKVMQKLPIKSAKRKQPALKSK